MSVTAKPATNFNLNINFNLNLKKYAGQVVLYRSVARVFDGTTSNLQPTTSN